MEKENERACKMGLPSPIFENKNLTDLSFNNALDKILIKEKQSIYTAMQLLQKTAEQCLIVVNSKNKYEILF